MAGPNRPSPVSNGPVSLQLSANAYLNEKRIPQIFESLMAGLMLECPDDHLSYLEDKLELIQEIGVENIDWDVFVVPLHPTKDLHRKEFVNDSEQVGAKKGYKHISDSELYPQNEASAEILVGHTKVFESTQSVESSNEKEPPAGCIRRNIL